MERIFSYVRVGEDLSLRLETSIVHADERRDIPYPLGLGGLLTTYMREACVAALRDEQILFLPSHLEGILRHEAGNRDTRMLTLAYGSPQGRLVLIGISGSRYVPERHVLLPGFVYVHPDLRRRGIGRLLIEERFRIGRRLGAERAMYLPLTLPSMHLADQLRASYPYEDGAYVLTLPHTS